MAGSTVATQLAADGVAVIEGVLDADEARHALDRLWAASRMSTERGVPPHFPNLDPNDASVRVFNLIDLDPVFGELIDHRAATGIVEGLIGRDYIVSNFSANVARPGSQSMVVHSDLAAVVPEPWPTPLSMNIMWCLTDVTADNGGTLHLPGSHRFTTVEELPTDARSQMVPLEAPAGSIIAMDGRVWHTSGANVTSDADRALLFAYYCVPHLRPQWNFSASLSPTVQAGFSKVMRYRLGLDIVLNLSNEEIFGDTMTKLGSNGESER